MIYFISFEVMITAIVASICPLCTLLWWHTHEAWFHLQCQHLQL